MPRKSKDYDWTRFNPDVIKRAYTAFVAFVPEGAPLPGQYTVETSDARWTLDTEEEFFAEYRAGNFTSHYARGVRVSDEQTYAIDLAFWSTLNSKTSVSVRLPQRSQVEAVFEIFEDAKAASSLARPSEPTREPPAPVPIKIFIGHGGSSDWRDLADHLRDHHHLEVEAFESGPRAGISNADVVLSMARSAAFALMVHTPEDETADGQLRARQNVVYETGLFQGRLGLAKAIIVRKDGCEDFSNLDGIQELRYGHNIREVFGDVVATLTREYPGFVMAPRRNRAPYWDVR